MILHAMTWITGLPEFVLQNSPTISWEEVKQIQTDSQLSNHHLKHFILGIFLFVLSNFTSISIALLSTGDDVKKKKKITEWPWSIKP